MVKVSNEPPSNEIYSDMFIQPFFGRSSIGGNYLWYQHMEFFCFLHFLCFHFCSVPLKVLPADSKALSSTLMSLPSAFEAFPTISETFSATSEAHRNDCEALSAATEALSAAYEALRGV